jgi:hypothetical protein
VVLLDEELPGARQRGVVGHLFVWVVGDPMVPAVYPGATLRC